MEEVLLDTDMLSEVLKGVDAVVSANARHYLRMQPRFRFSLVTKFQVLRGLKWKAASVQQVQFEQICRDSIILQIDDAVIERAAVLWAQAKTKGKPAEDADLLIAATALENNIALCTGNFDHYKWIPGLQLINWRLP